MTRVTVVGNTSWGTTLAIVLARKRLAVRLWTRTEAEATRLNLDRENKAYLPGFLLPPDLKVTHVLEEAMARASLVILAVPSQTMRANIRRIREHLTKDSLILSAAKGLEVGTTKRMSEVLAEELPDALLGNILALSGPNLAQEVVRGLLATSVVAGQNEEAASAAQELLITPAFRVYTNSDLVGVELGGALKNIIALGAGMGDGFGSGNNAKASLMTRGLAEITRLGVACGANPLTFAGLAGLGDLVATCSSSFSRNRHVGEELAKGRPLAEIQASLGHVAEGITTTAAARKLAQCLKVEMPITEQMYRVLFEGLDPRQGVAELMGREAKPELAGMGWASRAG